MLNQDTIREATRLTQAGQLAEATALSQRMLAGGSPPSTNTAHPPIAARQPRREPLTIDLNEANDVKFR